MAHAMRNEGRQMDKADTSFNYNFLTPFLEFGAEISYLKPASVITKLRSKCEQLFLNKNARYGGKFTYLAGSAS